MLDTFVPNLLAAVTIATQPSPTSQANPSAIVSSYLVTDPETHFLWKVQPGQTFTGIAQDYYGSADFWTTLWNDNPGIADPNNLPAGTSLSVRSRLPEQPEQLASSLAEKNIAITMPAAAQVQSTKTGFDTVLAAIQSDTTPTPTAVPVVEAAVAVKPSNFDSVYQAAGAEFGVPWQILYGIHMTETGGRDGAIQSHLGNGPEGPMQFMPGTFAAYQVPGHPNIDNAVDAIYAAANYLQKHGGWEPGLRAYGGNYYGTISYAEARGFTP